jgi:THAP domain
MYLCGGFSYVYRKQWIKVLRVERDVPRHYRICSKHFKVSDFFPRHQMQKKLMLRPSAVPTENLPPEITDLPYIDRPDSPENTSSSFVSLDQSDSSTNGVITSNNSPIILNNIINNNNTIITNNNNVLQSEYQEEVVVKLPETHFTYHPATPIQAAPIPTSVNFQPSSYETLTTLSTVPYQEISQDPAYSLYDGTEIDRNRLSSVLNKDDYQDGTITYVVNFVDY